MRRVRHAAIICLSILSNCNHLVLVISRYCAACRCLSDLQARKTMEIKYEYDSANDVCITLCPYGLRSSFGSEPIKVGSSLCHHCPHFVDDGIPDKMVVMCAHPQVCKTMTDKDKIKAKVTEMISALNERCNPDPFGSMMQCLAAAQIEALNMVIEYINKGL